MSESTTSGRRQAGAFDIRNFIAMLIGIYGVVLVLLGIFDTSAEDLERAGGLNINLWAGAGMAVVAAAFAAWARMRPVVVPAETDEPEPEDDR
jgi:drug/metabolite transporter (DMT)-like permease